jgi:hypothetical protein
MGGTVSAADEGGRFSLKRLKRMEAERDGRDVVTPTEARFEFTALGPGGAPEARVKVRASRSSEDLEWRYDYLTLEKEDGAMGWLDPVFLHKRAAAVGVGGTRRQSQRRRRRRRGDGGR